MGTTDKIKEQKVLADIIQDAAKELCSVLPVNQDAFYVDWRYENTGYKPSSITNVVIASYTTAQARLKLYSYLEKLGARVLYGFLYLSE